QNTISGNIFRGSRWSGVAQYSGAAALITRNEVLDNQQVGIALYERSGGVLISENKIHGNDHNGIWIAEGDDVIVVKNVVTRNGTEGVLYGGIGIGKGSPQLGDNDSHNNIGDGIWWRPEATPKIEAGNSSNGTMLPVTP
ncbi:MAG TPA: right-handed parallel beta-helix repeat-containing protein, partial [Opitutaceae bacterium]|nr:right-handed parallel beta-helix repeat-containing protein [Opitutaceae bacterium]